MALIDWFILAVYLFVSVAMGIVLASRNDNEDDYFIAGRKLTGWLAGASMAATTFSIDTPLYEAGLIGTRGLAGNWEWWSFGLAHVAMTGVFAPMWRRSGVLTDAGSHRLDMLLTKVWADFILPCVQPDGHSKKHTRTNILPKCLPKSNKNQ